ncbi:MAG: hypothetical protein WCG84_02665 [Candidatus Moraniibacteriota bacterium]
MKKYRIIALGAIIIGGYLIKLSGLPGGNQSSITLSNPPQTNSQDSQTSATLSPSTPSPSPNNQPATPSRKTKTS